MIHCVNNQYYFSNSSEGIKGYTSGLRLFFARIFCLTVTVYLDQKKVYLNKFATKNWLTTHTKLTNRGQSISEKIIIVLARRNLLGTHINRLDINKLSQPAFLELVECQDITHVNDLQFSKIANRASSFLLNKILPNIPFNLIYKFLNSQNAYSLLNKIDTNNILKLIEETKFNGFDCSWFQLLENRIQEFQIRYMSKELIKYLFNDLKHESICKKLAARLNVYQAMDLFSGRDFKFDVTFLTYTQCRQLIITFPKRANIIIPELNLPSGNILNDIYQKIKRLKPENYEDLFNLPYNYSELDIERSRKILLFKIHPDKNITLQNEAKLLSQSVCQIATVLINDLPLSRRK